jgi:hypothetical protein
MLMIFVAENIIALILVILIIVSPLQDDEGQVTRFAVLDGTIGFTVLGTKVFECNMLATKLYWRFHCQYCS